MKKRICIEYVYNFTGRRTLLVTPRISNTRVLDIQVVYMYIRVVICLLYIYIYCYIEIRGMGNTRYFVLVIMFWLFTLIYLVNTLGTRW